MSISSSALKRCPPIALNRQTRATTIEAGGLLSRLHFSYAACPSIEAGSRVAAAVLKIRADVDVQTVNARNVQMMLAGSPTTTRPSPLTETAACTLSGTIQTCTYRPSRSPASADVAASVCLSVRLSPPSAGNPLLRLERRGGDRPRLSAHPRSLSLSLSLSFSPSPCMRAAAGNANEATHST